MKHRQLTLHLAIVVATASSIALGQLPSESELPGRKPNRRLPAESELPPTNAPAPPRTPRGELPSEATLPTGNAQAPTKTDDVAREQLLRLRES